MQKLSIDLQLKQRIDTVDATFFINNRQKLARNIHNGLIILHSGCKQRVSTQESYDFRPNKMFYYFIGLVDPNLVAILKIIDGNVEPFLLIPKKDSLKEKWDGKQLTNQDCSYASGINLDNISYICNLQQLWEKLRTTNKHLPVWINMKDEQQKELRYYYNLSIDWKNITCMHEIASDMRSIKTPAEIAAIKRASRIASEGVISVIQNTEPGLYEYQLEATHDYVMKSHGLKSTQFKTILASGKNTTILHYLDNNQLVLENDLILMDIDVEVDAYHCDFTRVFPANGKFSPRQKEVYSAVLDVQKQLLSTLKPGITYGDFNELSKTLLAEACDQLGLFKQGQRLEDYYFHNVGHAIGLDTHDVGELHEETVLQEGMVLTVEPGLYIPEENIGVRIEDIVALTSHGHRNLTEHMVKEVQDIERLMVKEEENQ